MTRPKGLCCTAASRARRKTDGTSAPAFSTITVLFSATVGAVRCFVVLMI